MTIPPADTEAAARQKPPLQNPPAPLGGFSADEFKARRQALRAACPDGVILLRGAAEDDLPHGAAVVYRQNASFYYFTGVETPGAFLVLLPENVPAAASLRGAAAEVRDILYLPPRDAAAEAWTGPKLGPGDEAATATGIDRCVAATGLVPATAAWVRRCATVYTLTPYGEHARGTREYAMMQRVAEQAPVVQFRDCSAAVARLRAVKSAAELDRLRAAIEVTAAGHRAARAALRGERACGSLRLRPRCTPRFEAAARSPPSRRSSALGSTPRRSTTIRTTR